MPDLLRPHVLLCHVPLATPPPAFGRLRAASAGACGGLAHALIPLPENAAQSAAGGQQLSCAQKLVMALSVDSGDAVATSALELTLGCIGSPTGACPCPCDYASDLGCQCRWGARAAARCGLARA
jgi:hypothetical protein